MAYVNPSTNIVLIKNCILQKSVNDETDTLYFADITAQENYFSGLSNKVTYSPTTYQNIKQGVMRIGKNMKELYGCNYMYFTNSNNDVFENKTYYCFIDELKYINNNCTEVYYSIDYIQTFMFDFMEKTSLVERLTVQNDTIGQYLLDEGLNTGEYVVERVQTKYFSQWRYLVAYGSTVSLPQNKVEINGTSINKYGVFIGTKAGTSSGTPFMAMYFFELVYSTTSYLMNGTVPMKLIVVTGAKVYEVTEPVSAIQAKVNANYSTYDFGNSTTLIPLPDGSASVTGKDVFTMLYCANAVVDATGYSYTTTALNNSNTLFSNIVNVMIMPSELAPNDNTYYVNTTPTLRIVKPNKSYNDNGTIRYGMSQFGSYAPKNKKLFTYPYTYFIVSSTDGNSQDYRFELFDTQISADYAPFNFTGCGLPSPIACLYPKDYNGLHSNTGYNIYDENWNVYLANAYKALEYGVILSNFPMFSLKVDEYKKYMEQNRYRDSLDTVSAILSLSSSVVSSALAPSPTSIIGTANGAVDTIGKFLNMANEREMAKRIPDSFIGQLGTSDLAVANGVCGFRVLTMRIKEENARVIDDYFTRYGYKISRHLALNGKRNIRPYFTFIKTVECNISVDDMCMTQEDEKAIEAIYNSGIRYWNNPANYKDYSVDNSVT